MRNAGLDEDEHKPESRLPGEISITSGMQMHICILMAESEEELKSLSMKVKEESGKDGLKLNFQKTKITYRWLTDNEMMLNIIHYSVQSLSRV